MKTLIKFIRQFVLTFIFTSLVSPFAYTQSAQKVNQCESAFFATSMTTSSDLSSALKTIQSSTESLVSESTVAQEIMNYKTLLYKISKLKQMADYNPSSIAALESEILTRKNQLISLGVSENDLKLSAADLTQIKMNLEFEITTNSQIARQGDDQTEDIINQLSGIQAVKDRELSLGFIGIHSIHFSSDGKLMVVSGKTWSAEEVKIFDAQNFTLEKTLITQASKATAAKFSKDGKFVAVSTVDGALRVFDVSDYREIYALQHDQTLANFEFSADGKRLLTAEFFGPMRIWDFTSGQIVHTLEGNITEETTAAFFSKFSNQIVAIKKNGQMEFWDIPTQKIAQAIPHNNFPGFKPQLSPDGRYLAMASAPFGVVTLFDLQTGQEGNGMRTDSSIITALGFHPSGRFIAVGGFDNSITIFDTKTEKRIQKIDEHTFPIDTVNFSSDGGHLMSTENLREAVLWKIEKGRDLLDLKNLK